MAAISIKYVLILVLAASSWTSTISASERGEGARHHHHKRYLGLENGSRAGIARVQRYDGPSLAIEQLPGRLRPRYKLHDKEGAPHPRDMMFYRTLCRNGAPRRECVKSATAYDSGQLIEAVLNPPGPRTWGAVRFFGLPDVDGAPPVALLAKPSPQPTLPSPFGDQHHPLAFPHDVSRHGR